MAMAKGRAESMAMAVSRVRAEMRCTMWYGLVVPCQVVPSCCKLPHQTCCQLRHGRGGSHSVSGACGCPLGPARMALQEDRCAGLISQTGPGSDGPSGMGTARPSREVGPCGCHTGHTAHACLAIMTMCHSAVVERTRIPVVVVHWWRRLAGSDEHSPQLRALTSAPAH